MKRFTLAICLAFALFTNTTFSQNLDCLKLLENLKKEINEARPIVNEKEEEFKSLKDQLTVSEIKDSDVEKLKEIQKSIGDLKKDINKKINDFKSLKDVCSSNNAISEDEANKLMEDLDLTPFSEDKSKEVPTENQTYIYFNKNQIIKEDVIKNDGVEGKILNDIISQTNQETYLGDVTIPKDGEEFYFYKFITRGEKKEVKEEEEENKQEIKEKIKKGDTPDLQESLKQSEAILKEIEKDASAEFQRTEKKYKFKGIDIQIKDGNFFDIRLTVEFKGQPYLFENQKSVSFFRFNRMARDNYLSYANKQPFSIEDDISEIENYRIRLSDVLYYEYKVGNNYIPNDLVLELPQKDTEGKQTNLEGPATFQIKEDTYLDKIIELRAYTDFFAIFGEANNGLLQVEGSAKLYLFPYARPFFRTTGQYEFLKSLTPYVNYARFEDDNRLVQATPDTNMPTMGIFDQPLDIIEKRFLTMGVNLNVFEIYNKKYPVKGSLFASADYNITEAQFGMADPENIRSFGYGFGINIASKRFNNFGFNYNMEFKWFDLESFNSTESFNTELIVPVFKNEAEVYYHPTDNPNQAIFIRLRTFNYKGDTSNEAFYQFQFGYKFSLGSRSVKKSI
ncbi:MAG: hypothetical protein ED556_02195 [Winogradskyella sp.]|uniref:hypothetical protein n=1 Tax=Winogradskyella sp. TaxID=1883156 RepID=UPI000F3BDFFE|nr:hypothetical protein [Winogradskyella sp.]RNC88022.1 MAG: hypothetical protein ED556_02195 [Winogradskyella sp.]